MRTDPWKPSNPPFDSPRAQRLVGRDPTNWTAFVSALAFICLAVLLVVVPVPFVSWSPGRTRDTLGNVGNEPMIKVRGSTPIPRLAA
jgi:hypothetical protein